MWSTNSKTDSMTAEQLAARDAILNEFMIPPQYHLLIINSSSETSIKIKSPVDYVIVHDNDRDTQTQVRGRVNHDLDKLYIPWTADNDDLPIPVDFLNVRLFAEGKTLLSRLIGLRNAKAREYGWPTTKRLIEQYGYNVTEGRYDNKRYAIIHAKSV